MVDSLDEIGRRGRERAWGEREREGGREGERELEREERESDSHIPRMYVTALFPTDPMKYYIVA